MKRILLAGLFLWSSLASAALPLKTRGQNDSSTTGMDTLRLEAPNSQITQVGDQKILVETGNKNLLINPSFEHSTYTTGWTIPSGSGFFSEEVTSISDGKKAVFFDHSVSTGGGGTIYQQVDPPASKRSKNYEYSIDVYGHTSAATSLQVCVLDGPSQTQTQCQNVVRDNTYHTYTFNLKPPASGLTGIGVVGDPANRFFVDNAYVGPARNIGSGVPNNVFSAKVSSTGVVTDENEDFINGNCSVASNNFTCNFNSGKFSITPTCTLQTVNTSAVITEMRTQSASSIAYDTFISSSGGGSAQPVNITCTRAGSDFIQPAITPNQWNYEPRAYTPTISAAFGSLSNVSFFQWRTGKFLNVIGSFISGAPTNGTAASISLPTGLSLDTSNIPINNTSANPGNSWGTFSSSETTSGKMSNVVTAPTTSTTVVYIARPIGTGSGLTPTAVASTDFGSTSTFSVNFRVPIAGWTENQNAPQLLGSVTSNASTALREVFANFGSVCSSGTCALASSSGDVTVTRSSTGIYAMSVSPPFSNTMTCAANSDVAQTRKNVTESSSGVTYLTRSISDVNTDSNMSIRCIGPR